MNNQPQIVIVMVEYSPSQKRVIVRGVWPRDKFRALPLLHPDNQQNGVQVFLGVDMGPNVGFRNLIPGEEQ